MQQFWNSVLSDVKNLYFSAKMTPQGYFKIDKADSGYHNYEFF